MEKSKRTIPPTSRKAQKRLKNQATKLLKAAEEEESDTWPSLWPEEEYEDDFARMSAAHSGLVPLALSPLAASCPEYDPGWGFQRLDSLMSAPPFAAVDDGRHASTPELFESGGFNWAEEQSPTGINESCHWPGCAEPVGDPAKRRGRGRPEKWCREHKRPAKNRTERLRRKGIQVGKHRNLVYDFPGLAEQDLQGYRNLWIRLNRTARTTWH
ncbi:hypothetical protein [Streptomyces specialis]|uniref:hypothetical protein n=1 Tax=Streptomyces specialis TaxID=498367 RepID=UPI00131BAF62|nr:hypothetical protein [Streptomyces specialis]